MASRRCSVLTASRLPGGPHSAQPPQVFQRHFFVQGFALSAHQDLQTCGGVVEVVVAVAEAVLLGVVATHGEHPEQQSHEHLNDQLSKLCAQKDLHSPNRDVNVLVVVAIAVVVAGSVVVVVGACVGESPSKHCE